MKRLFISLPILFFLICTIACQQGEQVANEPKARVDIKADIQAIKGIVTEL